MVCTKCEGKLTSNITMDIWKQGSKNSVAGSKGRLVNENKSLGKRGGFKPYENNCRVCKQSVTMRGQHYCQGCAYKNGLFFCLGVIEGICSMCGVKILDTTFYKQSAK